MNVHLQEAMFAREGGLDAHIEITCIRCDGALSVGVSIRSLHTLELLAQSAELRGDEGEGRERCHEAVDSIWDALDHLDEPTPFP